MKIKPSSLLVVLPFCVWVAFKMKQFYKSKNKNSKDDELVVIDGDVLNYSLPYVKPGYGVTEN